MVKNTSGISAIVATVLIILITVAAVTIVWMAVIPMISESSAFDDPNVRLSIDTSGGWTFYDPDTGYLHVQVSRGSDEAEIIGYNIVVSMEGNGQTCDSREYGGMEVPDVGGKTTFVLDLSEKFSLVSEPNSVKVVPLISKGNEVVESSTGAGEVTNIKVDSAIGDTGSKSPSVPITPDFVVYISNQQNYEDSGMIGNKSLGNYSLYASSKKVEGRVYSPVYKNHKSDWYLYGVNANPNYHNVTTWLIANETLFDSGTISYFYLAVKFGEYGNYNSFPPLEEEFKYSESVVRSGISVKS